MKKKQLVLVESEAQIQNAICDYLAYRNYFFWRQNTAGVWDSKNQTHRRQPKYAINGIPDIILIAKGFFIGIEVKKQKGVQSENQKEFERRCNKAQGKYFLVRSVDEIMQIDHQIIQKL